MSGLVFKPIIFKIQRFVGFSTQPTLTNGDKITYKEYDIVNNRGGANAGIDRIVVGSDGRMYYTGTHYGDTGGKLFGRIK